MGVAHSNLPTIATLTLEMSICPLMLAMWLHSTRNFTSWGMAFALVFGWSIIIREAYLVDSPLVPLLGQDLIDAQLIYNGIYGFMCFGFALLGTFVCTILDLPGILPFHACLYGNRGPNHKLWRWGRKCPPPYRHTAVTFILFLFAILAPFVSYSLLMDDNRGWALGVAIIVPVITYIVAFLYWWYDTSLYVFGPTARNTKLGTKFQRGTFSSNYALGANGDDANDTTEGGDDNSEEDQGDDDSSTVNVEEPTKRRKKRLVKPLGKNEEGATRFRIIKTALVFAVTQIVCTMVLGFIRFADNNVDVNWIAACIVGGVIFLIAIILAIIFFFLVRRTQSATVVQTCDGGESRVYDMARNVPLGFYGITQRLNTMRTDFFSSSK